MTKNNADILVTLKPNFFDTKVYNEENVSGVTYQQFSLDDNLSATATSSFRYDPFGSGIRSTQQLNVDWSDFSQHVFFNSARVKTNEAFKTIINKFPFDGTQKDYEEFVDSLSGYQKYILDSFPVNMGYFYSNGNGYITVKDYSGVSELDISTNKSGLSVLNPTNSIDFSVENWLYLPTGSNQNAIILQKQSGSHGINLWVSASSSPLSCSIGFTINSESYSLTLSNSISKGNWNHICYTWNRADGENNLNFYLNGAKSTLTSSRIEIGDLSINNGNLTIFSGSTFLTNFGPFIPATIVTGGIDELRIWHKKIDENFILKNNKKNIFQSSDLKLYYKFNEPQGTTKNIILDYSSNNLFGIFTTRSYATSSIGNSPLIYEQKNLNPILFSNINSVTALREKLLASASVYDDQNPSIITNLIPNHYFLEGQSQTDSGTEEGNIVSSITGSLPKTVELGSTQPLNSLLYATADFFDEVQIFIKEFGNLIHIDYDNTRIISDYFLNFLANRYGVSLPDFFPNSTPSQFIYGNNIDSENSSVGISSLKEIQNKIWKRILINAKDILNSKGTKHSINLFLRSVGIEPYSFFKIKEYGGPLQKKINSSYEIKQEQFSFLAFTSSSHVTSSLLSSSRVEPGYPYIAGTSSDGYLTSGSWTYEGLYILSSSTSLSQSLVRLSTYNTASFQEVPLFNLTTEGNSLVLYGLPNVSFGPSEKLIIQVTGSFNLFNGEPWYVSFGRKRADSIENNSSLSSSYFVRVGKQLQGEIIEYYSKSVYYDDIKTSPGTNLLSNPPISLSYATGGLFLSFGSASLQNISSTQNYFDGKISQIKFWSKDVTEIETKEHIRNPKSIGVENPLINNQFEKVQSGSFEKIRVIIDMDQFVSYSDASGLITLTDFSQNNLNFYGGGFSPNTKVFENRNIRFGTLATSFDEAITDNKVRVRSLLQITNIEELYVRQAPLFQLEIEEQPTDTSKLSIDFSPVEVLNNDIITMFGDYEILNDILGDPSNLYSTEYTEFEKLRSLYFNRLTSPINLKAYFEFYKWFNATLSSFIKSLLAKNVNFKGINYIIQPHILERSKVRYFTYDQYLDRSNIASNSAQLLLQAINGVVRKY
jgi:hypothetical protein